MTAHRHPSEGQNLGPDGASASSVDPAASMSLLTSLLANPLDAGYEHYRAESGSRPTRFAIRLTVLALAVALGFGFVVAIASLRKPANDVKTDLKAQVAARSQEVTAIDQDVQSYGRAIDDLSQSGSPTPPDPATDTATASTPVTGPGITVTLADRNGPGKGNGAVRDQDLAMVVNALWAAGADAITINGQRLGPNTFIRTAGSVILVNVNPVSSPYEVAAIGDSNALSVALVRGMTGDYLSAAQSVTGMSVSTKVAQNLVMDGLALGSTQHATVVTSTQEGGSQ